MTRIIWCAWALALASLSAQAEDGNIAQMRNELRQLKEQIGQLERRLRQAEDAAINAQNTAVQAATRAASRPQAANAANPGISAVLNGLYSNLQRDPDRYRVNGFVPTQGEIAPPPRGLSLGESEIGIAANIDPWFRGAVVASISPDESSIEVEEGYIQTLGLSHGLTVKAGRFLSAIGYQNGIHAHAWDFADVPLPMKVFLGGRLNADGVQLRWVAPTSVYFDAGLELGRGRTFPAAARSKNGFGSANLFAHLGGDLGSSTAWQLGASHYRTSPNDRSYEDLDSTGTAVTNSFSGKSRLWALSGVLKWAPNGDARSTNFKLQGEYFRRKESGSLAYDVNSESLGNLTGGYVSSQSGWYLQGIYQFMPAWRVGYRFDRLDSGTTKLGFVDSGELTGADFPILGSYDPKRHTFMVDWSPSEFSRIRLQLSRDYARLGETDNQLYLQYIVSLGAHGGHAF